MTDQINDCLRDILAIADGPRPRVFELARERIEGLLLGADRQGDHFSVAQKIRDQLDQAFDGHRGGAAQFLGDIIQCLDEHYLGR
jgi:hypothetical protein